MMARIIAVSSWGLILVAFGCGSDSPSMLYVTPGTGVVCLAGQVDACDCGAGVQGVSTCAINGLSAGPCECPDGQAAPGMRPPAYVPMVGVNEPDGQNPVIGDGDGPDNVAPMMEVPVEPPPPPPDPRARDIRITEIAMYQAVKVSLVKDGAPVVARNAPIVVGKEAFVRVFVEPLPAFSARELEAELTLTSAESATEPLKVTQRISGSSSDPDLGSTINFDIPGDMITEDLQWAVTLRELDPAAATGTIDDAARFPSDMDTLEPLGARNAGPLRVMIVPYRYTADGSGRLPAIDDAQLEIFRQYIYTYYPIIEVQFEVHEPVDYNRAINPETGWETWLDSHCALRTQESPDPKVLYYGIAAPRSSMRAYGGGVAGLSFLPGPASNYGRCSVGLGFPGELAGFVMAHELGHALGLPHAPCGVDGGPFPYAEAKIGSWGFGLESRTLKEPDVYYDMMSYCDPTFISDYNYQKLFERVRYLNLQFDRVQSLAPQAYVRIFQFADGRREVMGRHMFDSPPGGDEERRPVQLLDAAGKPMGVEREGYFIPTAEGTGGVWLVPDEGQAAVVLDGEGQVAL